DLQSGWTGFSGWPWPSPDVGLWRSWDGVVVSKTAAPIAGTGAGNRPRPRAASAGHTVYPNRNGLSTAHFVGNSVATSDTPDPSRIDRSTPEWQACLLSSDRTRSAAYRPVRTNRLIFTSWLAGYCQRAEYSRHG